MKYLKRLILPTLLLGLTACTVSEQPNTSVTRVTDMLVTDLSEYLPAPKGDIDIYDSMDEVTGEYIELGSVQIQEINTRTTDEHLMSRLKDEARLLGGNGVLLVINESNSEDGNKETAITALAIYALDKAIIEDRLASL